MRDKQKQTKRHPRYYDERFFAEAEGFTMIPRSQAPPDPNNERFASSGWTIERAGKEIKKAAARQYLNPGEKGPVGSLVKVGPRGGRYYEVTPGMGAPEQKEPEESGAPEGPPRDTSGAPSGDHSWAKYKDHDCDHDGRKPWEVEISRFEGMSPEELEYANAREDIPMILRPDLTFETKSSARNYCGFGYMNIKDSLWEPQKGVTSPPKRLGMSYMDPAIREMTRNRVVLIEEGMDAQMGDREVFHGLKRVSSFGDNPMELDINSVEPGDVLSDRSLTSWTANPWTAYNFTTGGTGGEGQLPPYIMRIKSVKGVRGLYIGGGEYETILPHAMKYKVLSIDMVDVDRDAGPDPYEPLSHESPVNKTWKVITVEPVPGTDNEPVPQDDWTRCEASGIHWDLTRTGIPDFDEELIDGSYAYTGMLVWGSALDAEYTQKRALYAARTESRSAGYLDEHGVLMPKAHRGYEQGIDNDRVKELMDFYRDPSNTWKPLAIELDENGDITDFQEGRHRARALRNIANDEGKPNLRIPIWVFKKKRRKGRNTGDNLPTRADLGKIGLGNASIHHTREGSADEGPFLIKAARGPETDPARFTSDSWTITRGEAPIRKARQYLNPGEKAPAGHPEKVGPRGGRYYELKPGEKAPDEKAPAYDHPWARSAGGFEGPSYSEDRPDLIEETEFNKLAEKGEEAIIAGYAGRDIPYGWHPGHTKEERKANRDYTSNGYMHTKALLWPGSRNPKDMNYNELYIHVSATNREEQRQNLRLMQKGMMPLKEPRALFHGLMRLNDQGVSPVGVPLDSVKPGDVLSDYSLTSWSENPWTAYNFTDPGKTPPSKRGQERPDPYIMHIKNVKGVRGLYLGGYEYETVLPHGMQYRVISVDKVPVSPDAGISPRGSHESEKEYASRATSEKLEWNVITVEPVPGTDNEPVPEPDFSDYSCDGIRWNLKSTGIPELDAELQGETDNYQGQLVWMDQWDAREAILPRDSIGIFQDAKYNSQFDSENVLAIQRELDAEGARINHPFAIEIFEDGTKHRQIGEDRRDLAQAIFNRSRTLDHLDNSVPIWVFKKKGGEFPLSVEKIHSELGPVSIFGDTSGNPEGFVKKARKYLNPGERAPQGHQEKKGPRGGRYYDTAPVKDKEVPSKPPPGHVWPLPDDILDRADILKERLEKPGALLKPYPDMMRYKGEMIGTSMTIEGKKYRWSDCWVIDHKGYIRGILPHDEARIAQIELDKKDKEWRRANDPEWGVGPESRGWHKMDFDERAAGINRILSDDPELKKPHPEMQYFSGKFINDGININGKPFPDGSYWFVDLDDMVEVIPVESIWRREAEKQDEERVRRDLARRKQLRLNEYVPYSIETDRAICKFNQDIKGYTYEKGGLYSTDGVLLMSEIGNENSVVFSDEQSERFAGCILTHNHPNNSCFSSPDLHVSCQTSLREIRAVTPMGIEYIMRPPEGSHTFNYEMWLEIKPAYEEARERQKDHYKDLILSGKMDPDVANTEISVSIWKDVIKVIPLRLTIRPLDEGARTEEHRTHGEGV